MKTTDYFKENVKLRRPYILDKWCETAIRTPFKKVIQPDGRIRFWLFIPEFKKYLRVVTLEDGKTIHNAFFDRGFKGEDNEI